MSQRHGLSYCPVPPCWQGTLTFTFSRRLAGGGACSQQPQPPLVPAELRDKRITEVALGTQHTLAVTADGELLAAGSTEHGRLGLVGEQGFGPSADGGCTCCPTFRCLLLSAPICDEIWKFYKITGKAHAEAEQNLMVLLHPPSFLEAMLAATVQTWGPSICLPLHDFLVIGGGHVGCHCPNLGSLLPSASAPPFGLPWRPCWLQLSQHWVPAISSIRSTIQSCDEAMLAAPVPPSGPCVLLHLHRYLVLCGGHAGCHSPLLGAFFRLHLLHSLILFGGYAGCHRPTSVSAASGGCSLLHFGQDLI